MRYLPEIFTWDDEKEEREQQKKYPHVVSGLVMDTFPIGASGFLYDWLINHNED